MVLVILAKEEVALTPSYFCVERRKYNRKKSSSTIFELPEIYLKLSKSFTMAVAAKTNVQLKDNRTVCLIHFGLEKYRS